VLGLQLSSTGVNYGVTGVNASGTGSATGVLGIATATTGSVYGVVGESDSSSVGTAGVFGNDYTGRVVGGAGVSLPAGVRRERRTLTGLVGLVGCPSAFRARVVGLLVDTHCGVRDAGDMGMCLGVRVDRAG